MIGLANVSISGTSLLAVRRRLESRAKSYRFPFHFCIPLFLHTLRVITLLFALSTFPPCFLTLPVSISFPFIFLFPSLPGSQADNSAINLYR